MTVTNRDVERHAAVEAALKKVSWSGGMVPIGDAIVAVYDTLQRFDQEYSSMRQRFAQGQVLTGVDLAKDKTHGEGITEILKKNQADLELGRAVRALYDLVSDDVDYQFPLKAAPDRWRICGRLGELDGNIYSSLDLAIKRMLELAKAIYADPKLYRNK